MAQDTTPGQTKAVVGAGTALIGGAIAKIVLRVLTVYFPAFLDQSTIDTIDDLCTAGAVYVATYLAPHAMGSSTGA
jgi:hypothetical protein